MKFTSGIITLVAMTLFLSGCSRETKNVTTSFKLPPVLADCQAHRMRGDGDTNYAYITVFRCPHSDTTTLTHQKHPTSATVISP